MTSRDFCYWLQGYFELLDGSGNPRPPADPLTAAQVECIKRHLSMVFLHELDASAGSTKKQAALNKAHAKPRPEKEPEQAPGYTRPPVYRC